MFQKLVSHNPDLKKLVDKGYAVAIDSSNHLVIRDIPYLSGDGELKIGGIVAKLNFIDKYRFEQQDHQIYFAGSVPYSLDGKPIQNLAGGECSIGLSSSCTDIQVQRSFSNKPKVAGKYQDNFHKIETYMGFISGPAIEKFGASPYTFRLSDQVMDDPIFKFRDTLTSRSDLSDLSEKLSNDVVAIVGLGGTGAYVLDFLVKTPIKEIRGFDNDAYHVHNAFRSPGQLMESELGNSKAKVYQDRYDSFRHGLLIIDKYVDESCEQELAGVTFAFVCVDNGDARKEIFDLLISMKIPFIDVGMGLKIGSEGSLSGMVRTTYFPADMADTVRNKKWASESEDPENLYKLNIQISELNAINACIAVVQFKQLRGFYCSSDERLNTLLNVRSFTIARESRADEN
jgi:hypothetical protein